MDLASSPAKQFDYSVIEDLKFVKNKHGETLDLMAVAMTRGRDFQLPDFADMINFLHPGLNEIDWSFLRQLCENDSNCLEYVTRLEEVYVDAENIELLPGGLINFDFVFGPIFEAQFTNLISADNHWYDSGNEFTKDQIACLKGYSLSKILNSLKGLQNVTITDNPFNLTNNPCWQSLSPDQFELTLNVSSNSSCHFVSAAKQEIVLPTAITLAIIVVFVLFFVFLLYLPRMSRFMKKKMTKGRKISQAPKGCIFAKEFIGSSKFTRKWRPVFVQTDIKQCLIRLLDTVETKKVLRKVNIQEKAKQKPNSAAARKATEIINRSETLREITRRKAAVTPSVAPRYVMVESDLVISLRLPADAHLVLKFVSQHAKQRFLDKILQFLDDLQIDVIRFHSSKRKIIQNCVTKEQHRKRIEALLRFALLEASDTQGRKMSASTLNAAAFKHDMENIPFEEILQNCEITLPELATLLRTETTDQFANHLFDYIDTNKTGSIAYRDLVDFMAQLSKGNDRDRLHILFRLYDSDQDGFLTFTDFGNMLGSLSAMGNQKVSEDVLKNLFEEIAQKTVHEDETPMLSFDDFWGVFQQHESAINLKNMTLPGFLPENWASVGRRASAAPALKTVEEGEDHDSETEEQPTTSKENRALSIIPQQGTGHMDEENTGAINSFRSFLNSNLLEIFWGSLYVFFCLGLFCFRFYQSYSTQAPVIAIVSYGAPIARAAGLVINFTFATLVLLMARYVFTSLRNTFLRFYFPFDSIVEAHKFIAVINLIATIVHIFAHVANFYYMGYLKVEDLWCLMPELKGIKPPQGHSHFIWLGFETLTGLTGFLLIVVYVPIFAFAFGRSFVFRLFWITHQLWPIAALLLTFHGLGCLLQNPAFYAFFIGPALVLIFDRIISTLRRHADLRVVKFQALPSGVTFIEFAKPVELDYVAGQWLRINVPECGQEYHPFTITSAPHEPNLSLHILSVGPWTRRLNKLATQPRAKVDPLPLSFVRIEGPFGEGHQDWHRSDVAVLVGAGIGVTPFASILKHISHMLSFRYMPYSCKKVYFFWITRNQKHFEWFTNIIRHVEAVDKNDFVSTNICITQFPSKFDFRTIMLYICERHFQKVYGKSIFTGLKSTTHFGRPDFKVTLRGLKEAHPSARSIGVYTCGPTALIPTVERAVRENNKQDGPLITHYYETF